MKRVTFFSRSCLVQKEREEGRERRGEERGRGREGWRERERSGDLGRIWGWE